MPFYRKISFLIFFDSSKEIALSKDTFTKMKSIITNRNVSGFTPKSTLWNPTYPFTWMCLLDTKKRSRKKTWSSRNVVHQKNNENMDWKEVKRRSNCNGNSRIQKIPTQNHQKRTSINFGAYEQSWWTRKANIEWKDLWYQKQRKITHKIYSLNRHAYPLWQKRRTADIKKRNLIPKRGTSSTDLLLCLNP